MINNLSSRLKSRLAMVIIAIVGLVFMSVACSKSGSLPPQTNQPTPIEFVKPVNFPNIVYNFANNPLTEEGFELGRKLFYDGRLSKDGTISCGSCHKQENSFADDAAKLVSLGVADKQGTRNTTTIVNMAWSTSFFWDGRESDLDKQPVHPIENPVEMDEHLPVVVDKIKQDATYKMMFAKAFGSTEVTQTNLLKALSQFMVLCTSSNSKYDKVQRSEGETFSTEEQAGKTIFKQRCAPCHSTDLFTDNKFHSNGIIPGPLKDSGRYLFTKDLADVYLFKTPSLRNVAKSAPYMHDGRFATLSDVLDHYVNNSGIGILAGEKAKVIAFLNTLTDDTFLKNPKLAKQE
jgi:cytochrome c peroxidase